LRSGNRLEGFLTAAYRPFNLLVDESGRGHRHLARALLRLLQNRHHGLPRRPVSCRGPAAPARSAVPTHPNLAQGLHRNATAPAGGGLHPRGAPQTPRCSTGSGCGGGHLYVVRQEPVPGSLAVQVRRSAVEAEAAGGRIPISSPELQLTQREPHPYVRWR
jgi:hypothetical protein